MQTSLTSVLTLEGAELYDIFNHNRSENKPLCTYSVDSIKRTVHLAFHGFFFSIKNTVY